MIIYSVSVNIKKDAAEEWLQWMKEVHIPNVMKTGYFNDYTVYRTLFPENKDNFITYKINYELDSFKEYREYLEKEAPRLRLEVEEKYRGKFTASREVIELV